MPTLRIAPIKSNPARGRFIGSLHADLDAKPAFLVPQTAQKLDFGLNELVRLRIDLHNTRPNRSDNISPAGNC